MKWLSEAAKAKEDGLTLVQNQLDLYLMNYPDFVDYQHALGCLTCEMADLVIAINHRDDCEVGHEAAQIAALATRLVMMTEKRMANAEKSSRRRPKTATRSRSSR